MVKVKGKHCLWFLFGSVFTLSVILWFYSSMCFVKFFFSLSYGSMNIEKIKSYFIFFCSVSVMLSIQVELRLHSI